ncbi:MAG TPA: galactose-1-phosphate uridylyltransferase [Deltaproteobacteria bacterium]|jgi:UDPglucose--hexose-1-phosphate uridylyltransferase|nr:galactose-1-phosphate uridylyltransferase [Deltaproteobacteria bacterium]HQI00813.1 galactose-1-phosphate uridylyltransferase [Deltaproteobacteria bacterium]HQJ07354.1 galactose-1-phosphate uridylyltransferase [Deltaproteobacteria bacterium]
MSELRKDPVVDRWVIITEDPTLSTVIQGGPVGEPQDSFCPFCPGNEHFCPPEILANRPADSHANDSGWNLRVIPNRSPLLVIEEDLKRLGEGIYDKVTGVGANEVIIETPHHGRRQSCMGLDELENIFWAYRDRIIDLKKDGRMRYVLIYKNSGEAAGSTLGHTYSLLLALPIVPRNIADELHGAGKHFEYKERCIYCDIIRQEIQLELRVVSETKNFIAIEPFAPRLPFETWIIPKRHSCRFEEIEPKEVGDLAVIFKDVLSRLDCALSDPPYNYAVHTAPFDSAYERFYHWHVEIIPRIVTQGGLEFGSDIYVHSTMPEDAAAFLKNIIV